jgi:ribosomal protein L11 methyltransferase
MDQFKPMAFGHRLWIYPWNIEPPVDDGNIGRSDASMRVVVRLDPGLAFGSGTHPTTALCLEWLDGLDLHGRTITDYGCGSGILAIAALKLGAAAAIGIDNDPQALTASADNAARNGVADRLTLFLPEDRPDGATDVFVANILAGPLDTLAPTFAAAAKPGAPFAISGILAGQQDELLTRYAEWFEDLRADLRDDWVRISGRRRR